MAIEVYDSFAAAPLDEAAADGDDALVPGGEGVAYDPVGLEVEPRFLAAAIPADDRYVVPFRGPLRARARGRPVVALARALSRAGYLRWEGLAFTGYLGPRKATALRRFRADVGLEPVVLYDRAAHAKLARFYDAYSIRHLLHGDLDDRQREAFVAELMYLYNRRWSVRYTQARPFDLRKPPAGLDCSASGEWAAKWAGLESLSGYSSFGYGNTDTQLARFRRLGLVRIRLRDAELGDPRYYGVGGDPSHVAFVCSRTTGSIRVWSNGHYPIGIYEIDYRSDGIATCNLTGR